MVLGFSRLFVAEFYLLHFISKMTLFPNLNFHNGTSVINVYVIRAFYHI